MIPVLPAPKPLVTNSKPDKFVSLDGTLRDALTTLTYSVAKPVLLTFFKDNISSATKPVTFSTDIVVCAAVCIPFGAAAEPVRTVEFATYNCPPTALTVSFSNTAVFNVPLILAFSTSKNPPFCAVSLKPLPATSLANPVDSIVPSVAFKINLPPVNVVLPKVKPPIVPPLNNTCEPVICPVFVIFNAELAPNAIPSVPM